MIFTMKSTLIAAGGAALCAIAFSSCGGQSSAELKGPPPMSVSYYQVDTARATYFDEYPATVFALNQVDIRPEVSGYLTNIYFTDGARVKKGQNLYGIDPQHYQSAYDIARANLAVAQSNQVKFQQDVDRYSDLAKEDAVARQTLEHAQADLQAANMQVGAAQASLKSAQTDLRYSIIVAPFDGTIGISQVKIGSAVVAGQTLLNTVSSNDPMAVDCAVDEKQIPRFSALLQKKKALEDSVFSMVLPEGTPYPYAGTLSFLDRAVDPQTGTIRVRIIFPNPAGVLKPGLTCNLRVRTMSGAGGLLFPYAAVIEQMGEYFVFVVNGNKVSQKRVSLGMRLGTMVVAKEGLSVGDKIVTEGVQKLRDNAPVLLKEPEKEQLASSSPGTTNR